MSTSFRLSQLTDIIKGAGLAGHSMTEALQKVAHAEDLTGEEINRIAEMANQGVQLGLYKTASDKNFKFKLADPVAVRTAARKEANAIMDVEPSEDESMKVAAIFDDHGSDPFAAPYRPETTEGLSLYQHELSDADYFKLAYDQRELEDRTQIFELDKHRLEFEATLLEAKQAEALIESNSANLEEEVIQGALDMIVGNSVTLPDLYESMVAAVSGSTVAPEEMAAADEICMRIIKALKKKGVQNYQMGFRDHGDPAAMAKMTDKQLLDRCRQLSAYHPARQENTMSMRDTKTASTYFEHGIKTTDVPAHERSVSGAVNAQNLNNLRPSITEYRVPQMYLDDAQNTRDGKPRVFNATNEFVVAVKNLVGEQGRLHQVHAAQEYLGLKLKQIEEALRKLMSIRALEEERLTTAPDATGAHPQGVG